jgi:hypothetical protein
MVFKNVCNGLAMFSKYKPYIGSVRAEAEIWNVGRLE